MHIIKHSNNRTSWLLNIILITIFSLFSHFCQAQLKAIKGETSYPFLLNLPDNEKTDKQPIVVFLHGRSLSGTNLDRVKRYGVLYAMDKGQEVPGIIIAPQSKGGWDPDKVMEIVDYVIKNYNADPDRVYVCGMSMGGYGTMDVAGKYPDRIAAAVAICGGGNVKYADNLAQVPLWLQHGNRDRAVPMSESKKIVKAIKKSDPEADVTLTIIPGGTHGSVERLFHHDDIYNWLFKHNRKGS
ncbi:prolyl oligopeptidase family serine peptidase [Sphingobacterium sp. SRCM116780]|uniref:carboxylesterase family protein n=1 Tax=Sphingobacterium sp. SRCM116780 TaxID=2907623 RepID=UPI001F348619|nr:prolyl oligopeptidase family serine peptidase [Sphingobacterium sp. SRCM116780]UIR57601.1 prolyl oligopeptidase family serine peptidase [Sphingobacterium sp. SRCM116780]